MAESPPVAVARQEVGGHQPTLKHQRVRLGDDLAADTDNAALSEPRRIVPTYAVLDPRMDCGVHTAACTPRPASRSTS